MSTPSNLQVLFEDNHIIAVNKRSSDVVQGDGKGDKSLCEVVAEYVAKKYNKPGKAFIGTVHRLDRPVSGVILYAKTSKALSRLTVMFREREVQKTYWAVVKPSINPPQGKVVNYLKKNSRQNKSYVYETPGNNRKKAELNHKTVGNGDHYCFLEVMPKSGRHHQIRVTLSWLGSPIKGDVKYGARRTNENASVHLHARRIDFIHPVKKEAITIIAPPQEDSLWDKFLSIDINRR